MTISLITTPPPRSNRRQKNITSILRHEHTASFSLLSGNGRTLNGGEDPLPVFSSPGSAWIEPDSLSGRDEEARKPNSSAVFPKTSQSFC
jgi:hypothetical protein